MPSTTTTTTTTSTTTTRPAISSPLEAGQSILGAKQLPPQLTAALEYVSSRLMRKRLHLSLIVVRKDIQSPPTSPPLRTQSASPSKSVFSPLTRSLSRSSLRSTSSNTSTQSRSRTQWPSLPSSPREFKNNAPSSPLPASQSPFCPSPASSCDSWTTAQCPTPTSPGNLNPYGIKLIHACTMTHKAEKTLRYYVARAEKKFQIGSGWLSTQPLTSRITHAPTNDLIRRSLLQNQPLFSSEGLTLLSLDHVYTFKCALHAYSRSLSGADFTTAVDELRRLVLAHNGRRITKGYLMRAYDWMGVSLSALVDVNEGYKTAYGGVKRWGGIEVGSEEHRSPPALKTTFGKNETDFKRLRLDTSSICLKSSTNPSPKFGLGIVFEGGSDSEQGGRKELKEVAVGESAMGKSEEFEVVAPRGENSQVQRKGDAPQSPKSPGFNGFEDLTPVTKGEWLCLMVGDWKQKQPVAIC